MKVAREGGKLVFAFEGLDAVTFDATAATVNPIDAQMHGYEQKIRDNAAIARKQKDGTVITVTEQMRRDAVMEMVKHLTTSTEWSARVASAPKQNAAILALSVKLGKTYAETEAHIANMALAEMQ